MKKQKSVLVKKQRPISCGSSSKSLSKKIQTKREKKHKQITNASNSKKCMTTQSVSHSSSKDNKKSKYHTPKKTLNNQQKRQKTTNTFDRSEQQADYIQKTLQKMKTLKGKLNHQIQIQSGDKSTKKQTVKFNQMSLMESSPQRDTMSPYIKCTKSVYDSAVEETIPKKQKNIDIPKSILQRYWSQEKNERIGHQITEAFSGEYQKLDSNNLFVVNFRIIKSKIMEIEIIMLKRADQLIVSLRKGSLECQSVHQKYQNLNPKSSIIVMSAVYGCNSRDSYIYPEIQVHFVEKNGSFGLQKKVILPYTWIHLITVIQPQEFNIILQSSKSRKIKNKSCIDKIPYKKQIIERLLNIFHSNYEKKIVKKNKITRYNFFFRFMKDSPYILTLTIQNSECQLECETQEEENPSNILKAFDFVLQG